MQKRRNLLDQYEFVSHVFQTNKPFDFEHRIWAIFSLNRSYTCLFSLWVSLHFWPLFAILLCLTSANHWLWKEFPMITETCSNSAFGWLLSCVRMCELIIELDFEVVWSIIENLSHRQTPSSSQNNWLIAIVSARSGLFVCVFQTLGFVNDFASI